MPNNQAPGLLSPILFDKADAMTDTLDGMGDTVRLMNADTLKAIGKAHLVPRDPDVPTKYDIKLERELARLFESELTRRGYRCLTADHAENYRPTDVGWWAHLHKAKRNPLFPDYLIWDVYMKKPALQIELKVQDRWQPGQKAMVERGMWKLAWTWEQAVGYLNEWEAK